jgi:hypothetical protein
MRRGALFRAPEVTFDCAELGLDAFGYNIENETLRGELIVAAGRGPRFVSSKRRWRLLNRR